MCHGTGHQGERLLPVREFPADRRQLDGLASVCRTCRETGREGRLQARALAREVRDQLKICGANECPLAGEPQPRSAFTLNQARVDGLADECRRCRARRREVAQLRARHASALVTAGFLPPSILPPVISVELLGTKRCQLPSCRNPGPLHWHGLQLPTGHWIKQRLCLGCYVGFIGFRNDPKLLLEAAAWLTASPSPTVEAALHQADPDPDEDA